MTNLPRALLAAALAIAASLPFAGSAALAQAQAPAPVSLKDLLEQLKVKWNKPTEPFRVIGNVHYVGTDGLASYLITGPQGHVLVDTGLIEANPQIKANIAKLGFKLADVKILINTHAHIDHTAGLADLKAETGAQMIAGEADKPLLEGGYYPNNDDPSLGFAPVKVDRTVKTGDVVELGPIRLKAITTPGHSPGCTSWEMQVEEAGTKHSAIIFCSATVALNKLVGRPTHTSIVDDYKRTFAWGRTYKVDVLLAPHPEMYGMQKKRAAMAPDKPNPFVDPAEFNTYLASLEKAFDEGLAKQQASVK
jgi:metallo-beta-lactamase class B